MKEWVVVLALLRVFLFSLFGFSFVRVGFLVVVFVSTLAFRAAPPGARGESGEEDGGESRSLGSKTSNVGYFLWVVGTPGHSISSIPFLSSSDGNLTSGRRKNAGSSHISAMASCASLTIFARHFSTSGNLYINKKVLTSSSNSCPFNSSKSPLNT